LSEADLNLNSSRTHAYFPRGKSHRETVAKTTVGVYLPKTLVEKAKENKLNLSRILEEALSSILTHLEAQNRETSVKREGMETVGCHIGVVGRAGFEPATLRFLHPRMYAW
jgi:post-segregation antitoxin (ccd killing protein)